MQQVMSLRRAIKENYISIGTELRYEPDNSSVDVIEKRSGIKEKQKFQTTIFQWRLVELTNNQLVLIPMESTKAFLTLRGKAGAEKSKKTLNIICSKLWSSKRLNLEAKALEMHEYERMPSHVKRTIKDVWLSEHYPEEINGDFMEVVHYVDKYSCCKDYPLYSRKHGEQSLSKEIIPIIYLPNEMFIDISTNMLFRQKHQAAKYKLAILLEKELPEDIKTELQEIMNLIRNL